MEAGAEAHAILIVEEGAALCGGTGAEFRRGQALGAMEMLMGRRYAATVLAAAPTLVLQLRKPDAKPIVEKCWGTRAEIFKRKDLLEGVPLFAELEEDALLQLTVVLRREVYAHGTSICTEGRFADCLHLIVAGNVVVHSREHGRLTSLGPGSYFGEVGILAEQSWRTATVKADSDSCIDGSTECFRLRRRDVQHLLSSEQCAPALADSRAVYDARAAVRTSDDVREVIDKFYDALAVAGAVADADGKVSQKWGVSRGGYARLHMMITKILRSGFTDEEAEASARNDWAEDIVSFESGEKVNAALEAAKTQLRDLVSAAIETEGWGCLGEDRIDANEFIQACRDEIQLPESALDDETLEDIFACCEDAMPTYGAGVSGPEFANWLSGVCASDRAAVVTPAVAVAHALRKASKVEITKQGWERAFCRYHSGDLTDGSYNELGFDEFAVVIKALCDGYAPPAREKLRQIFRHVDASRSGKISSAVLCRWVNHAPMDQPMSVDSFAEGLFQLSHLWASKVESIDPSESDRDHQFLKWLLDAVTRVEGSGEDDGLNQRRLKRMDEIGPGANKAVKSRVPGFTKSEPVTEAASEPTQVATSIDSATDAATVDPGAAPVPTPPTRPHKKQVSHREPLFQWPHAHPSRKNTSRHKQPNPNLVARWGVGWDSSGVQGGTARAVSPRGKSSAVAAPATQRQQRQQESTVESVLIDMYSAAPRRQRTPDSDSAQQLWSTKHHPSSARQARRTTGSGGVSGRPPSALSAVHSMHTSVAASVHYTAAVIVPKAPFQKPITYAVLGRNNRGAAAYVPRRSTARPSTAPQQRVTIAPPPPSKQKGAATATVAAAVGPKRPTSTDIIFNSSARLRPQAASPRMGGNRRTPAEPVVTSARQQRPKTAAAAASGGRVSSRGSREEEHDLGLAWLAAGGAEGENLAGFFEINGKGGRCRPAAAAKQHVMAVGSRGAYRSGRPEVDGPRPTSGRPRPPPGWDRPAFKGRPKLTRQQVASLVTNGTLFNTETLTELG